MPYNKRTMKDKQCSGVKRRNLCKQAEFSSNYGMDSREVQRIRHAVDKAMREGVQVLIYGTPPPQNNNNMLTSLRSQVLFVILLLCFGIPALAWLTVERTEEPQRELAVSDVSTPLASWHDVCTFEAYPTLYALRYEFTTEDGEVFYEPIMHTDGYIYFEMKDGAAYMYDHSCDDTTAGAQLPDSMVIHRVSKMSDGYVVQAQRIWTGDGASYETSLFLFRRSSDADPYSLTHYIRTGEGWECVYSLTPIKADAACLTNMGLGYEQLQ